MSARASLRDCSQPGTSASAARPARMLGERRSGSRRTAPRAPRAARASPGRPGARAPSPRARALHALLGREPLLVAARAAPPRSLPAPRAPAASSLSTVSRSARVSPRRACAWMIGSSPEASSASSSARRRSELRALLASCAPCRRATELSVERRDSTRTCRSRALTCRLCACERASARAVRRSSRSRAELGVPRPPAASRVACGARKFRARPRAAPPGWRRARARAHRHPAAVARRAAAIPRRGCARPASAASTIRVRAVRLLQRVLGGLALAFGPRKPAARRAERRLRRAARARAAARGRGAQLLQALLALEDARHAGRCRGSRAASRAPPTRPAG